MDYVDPAVLSGVPPREHLLFISHAWDYEGDYEGLVNLLGTYDPTFRWKDLSITKDDPLPTLRHLPKSNRYLVHQLEACIPRADCVLVIAAMYVAHRAWIQSEIEIAKDAGKPIVAIVPQGQVRLPDALMHAANEQVGWNRASIIGAIHKLVTMPSIPTPGISFGRPSAIAEQLGRGQRLPLADPNTLAGVPQIRPEQPGTGQRLPLSDLSALADLPRLVRS